jgi:hypothetical protein
MAKNNPVLFSLTRYTLENPPIPIHRMKSKSFKPIRDDLTSCSFFTIGSMIRGWFGQVTSKVSGLSTFERT